MTATLPRLPLAGLIAATTEAQEVVAVRADGNVITDYGRGSSPAWSPDGSRLAFIVESGVVIVHPDGVVAALVTPEVAGAQPQGRLGWSPDGARLLFEVWDGARSATHLVYADGSGELRLFEGVDAEWSPDGERVLYRTQDPPVEYRVHDVATRHDVTVPLEADVSWSPGGGFLIGVGVDRRVMMVDTFTLEERLLIEDGSDSQHDPQWSPIGDRIAYVATTGVQSAVFVALPDGSGSRELVRSGPTGDPLGPIAWSRDGALLAVTWLSGLDEDIVVHDLSGNVVWETVSDHEGETFEGWAPDSRSFLWSGSDDVGLFSLYVETIGEVGLELGPLGSPSWQPVTFTDVDRSVFRTDVFWMWREEISRGCNPPANDRYCPDRVLTRGEVATFLVRALGLTARLDDPFTDDDESIFEADIERLAAAGVTRGCDPPANDKFCPDDPVTRGQMAAFLVRALRLTDDGGGGLFVDDDGSIFEHDIDKLGTAGVTHGCNPPANDRFCPNDVVTRGQIAAFLHRALG